MKCIKEKPTSTADVKNVPIYRVRNDIAARLVSSGRYVYCPKSEWKHYREVNKIVEEKPNDKL